MVIKDGLSLHGQCTLRAWRAGKIWPLLRAGVPLGVIADVIKPVDVVHVNNLIVTAGKGLCGDALLPLGTIGLTYHAIGTGVTVPNVADTHITTEVRRKIWAASSRTGSVVDYQAYYLVTECTYFVKECGVYGGPLATDTLNSGTLFSHFLFSYDNSGGLNDLTFEYQLTIA